MTDMKKSIKITVASISALVLAMACIVAAPLLKDVLNDIVNPAYRETVIFPECFIRYVPLRCVHSLFSLKTAGNTH